MTSTLRAASAVFAVLLAGPALQAQPVLKYKFKAGDTLRYDLTTTTKQSTRAGDNEFGGTQKQVIAMTWKVDSIDDKGAAKVHIKFDRVKLTTEQPKESIEVASDDKAEPEKEQAKGMMTLAKTLAKLDGYFTMSPLGEIKDVTIPATTLKDMRSVPGAEKMEDSWAQGNLQATLKDATLSLPGEPIAKGKSWKTKIEGTTPFGKLSGDTEVIYKGKVARGNQTLDVFEIQPKLKIEPDPKAKVAVTVKRYDNEGTAYFDNDAGRLVESTTTQNIEVQTEVMGKTLTQKSEGTNSLKLVK
jgi:hypothetical protein